jgi:hypothetical protein
MTVELQELAACIGRENSSQSKSLLSLNPRRSNIFLTMIYHTLAAAVWLWAKSQANVIPRQAVRWKQSAPLCLRIWNY